MHGGALRLVYITLVPSCKPASQVCFQTPRTSYSSRRSRVEHRRKRKLDPPRVVQKPNQKYPIRWRSRGDFPEPPQTVVALVQNVGPFGKHSVAVSVKPIGVRYTAITGCQQPLTVTPRKLPLCRADSHPAVQVSGLAALVRGAGPVAPMFVARKLKVRFPFL